jgi:hypothetical protein
MGMMYTAQFNGVAVTAQQDFFELLAPSDAVVIVHMVLLTQTTEAGDAQEEQLSILFKRGVGSVTSGSGGSTPTPAKTESGFAAAGSTVEANNTTKMATGSGTITTLDADSWNVRADKTWLMPPELRIILSPGERLTVELGTTPADSITMNGVIKFEELGG